ncbi:SUKH-4 family immunity protein [Saccharibacillus alkalitolerans]|uniref:Knr4/Smi1-like domain-containing protein n=1 Tax=Saccharibacillus alkalitolerans TaxID=2705290 RepID=A0ABX0FCD6_9BACL|nr:SUKH-4 family immunity protein [Saccharibacillus alkalitolerans]NGZ77619.1 hypothetical protein [Saccharibacillus alkalitolerans]
MEPVIRELRSRFTLLDPEEIERSEALLELFGARSRLTPYRNFAIEFDTPPCRLLLEGRTLIVFGHDLGGYFAVDAENETVVYVHQEDGLYRLMFCNSNFGDFAAFHNSFLEQVQRRIKFRGSLQESANELELFFGRRDPRATERDDLFWPMRLYELADGLFPLNDSRINFYQSMLDAEN